MSGDLLRLVRNCGYPLDGNVFIVVRMDGASHEIALGELLALLVGAHRSFRTLQGEVRTWTHHERSREAFARMQARRGTSHSQSLVVLAADGEAEADPGVSEVSLRVWLERPDRLREEAVTVSGGRRNEYLLVRVGATWWSFDPDLGAQTNGEDLSHGHGGMLERAMLDPAQLLATSELEVVGRAVHAGRPVIRVFARPSPRDVFLDDPGGMIDCSPRELLVDAERGVLLRSASLLDGEPFATCEFLSVVFDQEIASERFVFVPPAGEEVVDAREAMERLHRPVSLDEAARLAPFVVFAPREVPASWSCHVLFGEPDERRGRPAATVHVHYGDHHARVSIDQRAASDNALPDRAPDGNEWQIAATASGEVRLWEPSDAERGMPRIALLVASGTRVQIATGDLTLAELAELAGALEPVTADE